MPIRLYDEAGLIGTVKKSIATSHMPRAVLFNGELFLNRSDGNDYGKVAALPVTLDQVDLVARPVAEPETPATTSQEAPKAAQVEKKASGDGKKPASE